MRRDDEGGWGYFPNRRWAVTEIGAWVTLANAYALRSPLVVSDNVKATLRSRIMRDLKDLAERHNQSSDADLSAEDRRLAGKLRTRLLSLHKDELENVEQAFTYELAETLIGLDFALRPTAPSTTTRR